ncbi:SAM-dependent DNA methyltransferase [Variovorax atrisoli]|uniref:Eco57I restriction-modification methylase domain-containing protein n=1 Tax=Variovorax atrisoli TaxID=3394203 RepID=UPI000F7E05A1|nr:N-6 DNA methylase [Variovorax sp. 369]RTD84978.1 SAM-dependent DNA methyltransferase [Variovorax sp. 369]
MRSVRRHAAALNLPTLQLEGGLFLPDVLEKAALGLARLQTEADYRLPKGLKFKDEYSRAFQIASAQWRAFSPLLERTDVPAQHASASFITELLRDALAYPVVAASTGLTVGDRHYPITHLATGPAGTGGAPSHAIPIVVAPHTLGLDEPHPRFAVQHAGGGNSGSRKKSAFQLAQELLNASPDHHWALISNGKTLRLLRDAATLTRPSYLDIDLQDLLAGQRLAEFAYAWRLLHASRAGLLPATDGSPAPLAWEAWREAGQEEGTRVRNGLRRGVTQALITLGQGFVQHPANNVLRQALQDGSLGQDAYYAQLLRLIYRFIFVFSIEERGLIPNASQPGDDEATLRAKHAAAHAYAQGYALARLRDMSLRRRARTRFDDLWQGVKIVFQGLAHGQTRLGLPALGGLFAPTQCPALDAAQLSNADLLAAMHSLRWARQPGAPLAPIDYRNMGTEELGSVYESLLELVPEVDLPARRFGFVGLDAEGNAASTVAGNDRKLTGSYYTPDTLVQQLIHSALDPVIDQRLAAQPANPVQALLAIRVIDPACGSGHFLLSAARRLAERLASLRAPDGAVTPLVYRQALREIIARCIFGVDRNPMAIELARTALWLEGFEEGRPLGFLDHHLQVGDALLGLTDLKALEHGIAKDAFKPLSGDDKDACKQLAKTNAAALKDLEKKRIAQAFGQLDVAHQSDSGLAALQALEVLPEDTAAEIAAKEAAYRQFLQLARTGRLAQAADLLLGAYLLPKTVSTVHAVPTTATLYLTLQGEALSANQHDALLASQAACRKARVLHWPLAFPQVFAANGFDCVLGNPPWERIKLQEEEFFASRHRDVEQAKNKAERSQRIQWLSEGMLARHLYPELGHALHESEAEQRLYREFITARRTAEASSLFAHVKGDDGGRYPLTGVGDVNTYALFAETIGQITRADGRSGFIVPSGLGTDDSTKRFFQSLVTSKRLVSFFGFDNAKRIFPAVHPDTPFALVTIGTTYTEAELAHYLLAVEELADPRRRFTLSSDEFRLINPNTLTCPVFRSERDAELTKKLYRAAPVLIDENNPDGNPWGISFMAMMHMSSDSHLFADAPGEGQLPLYEAKMVHQFDHRWATYGAHGKSRDATEVEKADPAYTVTPRYWVSQSEVSQRLADKGWDRGWLMGWRDITNATNERTVIASVVPLVGVGNKIPLFIMKSEFHGPKAAAFLGNLSALVFDFVARQKIGGTTLNYFYMKQFPVLPPDRYTETDLAFIVPRVLELTYTAHDLADWAQDLGHNGPPFLFDPERRALLRAELDAYYARLYSLTSDELRYILDPADVMGQDYPSETFRVLKNKERIPGTHQYRTQQLVLAAWEALETQQPITIPAPKPSRRRAPLPIYAEGSTPASESEDWLAGLICDVLLQAGPCDDHQLRRVLGARLPEGTPHAEVLHDWSAPVSTERWAHIGSWLRALLGVSVTAPLSIHNPEALVEVLGDHRTESLARALIEARRQQDAALAGILAGSAPDAQSDEIRKQG